MIVLQGVAVRNGVEDFAVLSGNPESSAELEEGDLAQHGVEADGLGRLLGIAL